VGCAQSRGSVSLDLLRSSYGLISLLKRGIETFGYRISRKQALNGPVLDLLGLVVPYVRQHYGGGIIQVGANDGLLQDPVHALIRQYGIPAILVEPLPDIFDRLKVNYAGVQGVRFMNAAISHTPGETQMFRIKTGVAGLPDWVGGVATFDKETLIAHSLKRLRIKTTLFASYVESVKVSVITMRELLAQNADFGIIMMLQIDTEGHDANVVKSALQAGLLPPIIRYEHKLLPLAEQVNCRQLLADQGYSFASDDSDTLCLREAALAIQTPSPAIATAGVADQVYQIGWPSA